MTDARSTLLAGLLSGGGVTFPSGTQTYWPMPVGGPAVDDLVVQALGDQHGHRLAVGLGHLRERVVTQRSGDVPADPVAPGGHVDIGGAGTGAVDASCAIGRLWLLLLRKQAGAIEWPILICNHNKAGAILLLLFLRHEDGPIE